MSQQLFTVDDLRRVLRDAAGEATGSNLDGDILDTDFEVLGYESLALLETGGRVEREYGVKLDEDALTEVTTPRELLEIVNNGLGASAVSAG